MSIPCAGNLDIKCISAHRPYPTLGSPSVPMGGVGLPVEVAKPVIFLASDEAARRHRPNLLGRRRRDFLCADAAQRIFLRGTENAQTTKMGIVADDLTVLADVAARCPPPPGSSASACRRTTS